MQHLLRRLILFLSLAATVGSIPQRAFASHIAGADLTYTCLGGNTYRIDLTFYRNCKSLSTHPNGYAIEFNSISCNRHFTDTILLVSGTGNEISYPCPGLTTACDDPTSTNPGIQEWKYSGVVTFPMQCADWVISWKGLNRNCDITTIVVPLPCNQGTNPPVYITANLDNLNYTCNSSPRFTNIPIVFVCVGQNFTYNHGAFDPDGDSLAYSLVDPLIAANTPVTFQPGYSATSPIMSTPPLTIDPLSGDIVMTPTQQEVGVLSVEVDEYRNGVLIGHVTRDMEIYVQPCNNNLPTATGINGTPIRDTTVCPGTQICFDVFSNDIDTGQIVTMTWNQQILNATFTVSGFPYPTGHFCWTPGVNDISSIPHQFTVTVVDNACPNSGYQSYAFLIRVNSPLVNINLTDISCHGSNDGSIKVVPVNPGGFSYSWSPGGQTTDSISNLSAGSYPVTVYDSTTGCSATFPNTITDPAVLTDSAYSVTASCTGSSSGVAVAVASGGTPQYSFSWNTLPPILNDTASGIPPGTYIVTVTDSHGCTASDSVTVNTSSSALIISVDSVSSLQCYTDTNGIAIVSVTGGVPGYTYLWNTVPPQTDSIATGLSPGSYIVTITDSLGCSTTDTATVSSPPQIVVTGHSVNASCNSSDGIAFVTVTGGVPGYTYVWTGFPSTTDSLLNVPPAVYHITVTDTVGCSMAASVVVGSQTITTTASTITPVGCRGDSNAVAVVTASGGTAPYTFSWNTVPPQLNDTATGLWAGNYIVTITDSNNCSTIDTVNVPDPSQLNLVLNMVNASCAGDSSGSATVHINGGVGPYNILWSPYGGTDTTATQLIPGAYTVTVVDAAGCTMQLTDSIHQNTTLTITVNSTIPANCNGTNTGSIDISVSGGSGSYTYLWSPGGSTTQDITNIDAGNYQVIVTDGNNCSQTQTASVGQPAPVPSDAGRDSAICAGSTIQLNAAAPTGGNIGVWSSSTVPSTSFSNINDPNAVVINVPPGFNVFTWTVTDINGCSSPDNVTIFNFNLAVSAGNDINLCALTPVQLNATSFVGYNGLWTESSNLVTFDDSTLSNATINLSNYGTDTLTWTISSNACSGSDNLVVSAFEQPTADAGNSSNVCEAKANLIAVVTMPGTGMWSVRQPSIAIIADSLNSSTVATNLPADTSIFIWTMSNGFCSASDTIIVFYDQTCELDLPSAFSPNGDGHDDSYVIKGIEGYPNNTFTVFNRWGNEVYTKQNYTVQDPVGQTGGDWIGQNKSGADLPEGTYYVVLRINDHNITRNTYVDLRRYVKQ